MQMNMGQLFAKAKEQGHDYEDLPLGEFDVRVKGARAHTTQKGAPRLLVTYEALSGAGTVMDGKNAPDESSTEGAIYYWFQFLKAAGLTEEYFTSPANANNTLEDIARDISNLPEVTRRIKISKNGTYTNVDVVGPATGAADAPEGAGPATPPPPAVPGAAVPPPPYAQS